MLHVINHCPSSYELELTLEHPSHLFLVRTCVLLLDHSKQRPWLCKEDGKFQQGY